MEYFIFFKVKRSFFSLDVFILFLLKLLIILAFDLDQLKADLLKLFVKDWNYNRDVAGSDKNLVNI